MAKYKRQSLADTSDGCTTNDGDQRASHAKRKPRIGKEARTQMSIATVWNANQSPLLQLPAELRIEIYRLALVNAGGWVRVDREHHDQPALLRVCKQTRGEAGPIFYQENHFELVSFDARQPVPSKHWANRNVGCGKWGIGFNGHFLWSNLKGWLKLWHNRTVTHGLLESEEDSTEAGAVAHAFSIVEAMDGVDWTVVEKVLEHYRKTLEEKRGRWKFAD